jgi:GNAT superfamily N-acetyltransferase
MRKPAAFEIRSGYSPGDIAAVTGLHMAYYAPACGFGLHFEALVASELAAFLGRFDPARDGFWTAQSGGLVGGAVAVAGEEGGEARLRWFIVDPSLQGRGIGGRLLGEALAFSRGAGYSRLRLHTFAGLDAARHLYEKAGFVLVEEHPGSTWGAPVTEQTFVLDLAR